MMDPNLTMAGLIRTYFGRVTWQTRARLIVVPGDIANTLSWKPNFDKLEPGQLVSFENQLDKDITVKVGDDFVGVFGVLQVPSIPAGMSVTLRVRDDAPLDKEDIGFKIEALGTDGGGPVIGTKKPPGGSGTG